MEQGISHGKGDTRLAEGISLLFDMDAKLLDRYDTCLIVNPGTRIRMPYLYLRGIFGRKGFQK